MEEADGSWRDRSRIEAAELEGVHSEDRGHAVFIDAASLRADQYHVHGRIGIHDRHSAGKTAGVVRCNQRREADNPLRTGIIEHGNSCVW